MAAQIETSAEPALYPPRIAAPEKPMPVWRLKVAAYASVWWLQNPSKPLEAITTAVREAIKPKDQWAGPQTLAWLNEMNCSAQSMNSRDAFALEDQVVLDDNQLQRAKSWMNCGLTS